MGEVVLVTGASGFIGSRLLPAVTRHGLSVRATIRNMERAALLPAGTDYIEVADLGRSMHWSAALEGVGVVIHLAATAHRLHDKRAVALSQFRRVNTQGTLRLGMESAKAGAKRFVYVSSIGVNGSATMGKPFSESDVPAPGSSYAISKWEAEQGLYKLQKETGMEVVVVRPPLVYGPGAPGNLARLMRVIWQGVPLPLASVHNRRSFIGVDNLVDLLVSCAVHPAAAGETFLAADGEDLSTPKLIRYLAKGLGCSARLFPFPVMVIRVAADILGKTALCDSLCSSLQVDAAKATALLDWRPRVSVADGLAQTVQWYRETQGA